MPPAINLGRAGRQPRMYDCRSALPRPAVGSGSAPCGGPTRTDSVEPPAGTVCWPQGKEASSMHADDEAATRTTGSLRSCGRHRSISCERGCSTPRRRDARSGRRVVRSACPSQDVALPPWLAQPFCITCRATPARRWKGCRRLCRHRGRPARLNCGWFPRIVQTRRRVGGLSGSAAR